MLIGNCREQFRPLLTQTSPMVRWPPKPQNGKSWGSTASGHPTRSNPRSFCVLVRLMAESVGTQPFSFVSLPR